MTVAPDTLEQILEDPGGFVLQVQRATDQDAAAQALAAAVCDIHALHDELDDEDARGPHMVSEVSGCPTGPYVYVDAPGVDDELLARYPELVAARLAEAGEPQAVVAVPEPTGHYDLLHELPHAALLCAFTMPAPPAPETSMPSSWVDRAVAWLRGAGPQPETIWGCGPWAVEFSVPSGAASELLHDARQTATRHVLVAGDLRQAVRGARLDYLPTPCMVLATAGPAMDAAALTAASQALRDEARQLAPEAAYAFIATAPTFAGLVSGPGRLQLPDRYLDTSQLARVADELALDAFWHQILSPGHLRALGPSPPPGAVPLARGRMELTLGDPLAWLATDGASQALRAAGRATLAGCLYDEPRARALLRRRLAGPPPA
jgi:hypothetical protein